MAVKVNILTPKRIEIKLYDTEEEFKRLTMWDLKIMAERDTGIPAQISWLVIDGKRLLDHNLSEYKIQHMSVIHLLLDLRGDGPPEQEEAGGSMGDKTAKNMSKEQLFLFDDPDVDPPD